MLWKNVITYKASFVCISWQDAGTGEAGKNAE
jgi:hypothetical protein